MKLPWSGVELLENQFTMPVRCLVLPVLKTLAVELTPSFIYLKVAWPDTRNAAVVRALRTKAESVKFTTTQGEVAGEDGVRAITGLPFSCVPRFAILQLFTDACELDRTYFSSTKIAWLLEEVPAVKEASISGDLMIGTVDSWLLFVRLKKGSRYYLIC